MSRNPNHLVMCCEGCGKDTKASTGYCRECYGKGTPRGKSEASGRSARALASVDATEEQFASYVAAKEQQQ